MTPFFIILILIFLIYIIISLSVIQIEVKYLDYNSEKKENNYLIYLRLKFLKKVTWAKIKLDNKGIEKYRKINNKILQKIKNDLKNEIFELKKIKKYRITLKRVNLKIKIGLIDAVFTSLAVGVISSIISLIIAKNLEEYNEKKCEYKILPAYNKFGLKINLKCIITVKMVHIISIVYMLFKKGSAKYGKFPSNRRPYESFND